MIPRAASSQPESLVNQFERRSHTSDSLTLPYRLFVPENYDPSVQYPLVLTLHGSGERGSDNRNQIAFNRVATSWADPVNQSRWPAFVVSPQAPSGGFWLRGRVLPGQTTLATVTPEVFTVMSLLDSLQTEFNIDLDRVYVTGYSLGAVGTYDVAARFAKRFAAAIPVSGVFLPSYVGLLNGLPFWIFHGEDDGTVQSFWSRGMIEGFLDVGREVLFTNCGIVVSQCSPISGATFQEAVDRHVDVIYTGLPNRGHGIAQESYDDPRLAPWVFSQHRLVQDGIQISTRIDHPVWSGVESIEWNITEPTETGELWYSVDNRETWTEIDSSVANTGAMELDTRLLEDTPFAYVRLVFYDADGFVHKKEDSGPFVVDNPGNGSPFVRIDGRPFRVIPNDANNAKAPVVIEDDAIELMVLASDPEFQTLDATVHYSVDDGKTWGLIKTLVLESSTAPQAIQIDLSSLANANAAMLRVEISDGERSALDQTARFTKLTPRSNGAFAEHVAGPSGAEIDVYVVSPSLLTGHTYRVSFSTLSKRVNAFTVTDLDLAKVVLSSIPLTGTESPEFDGIRLRVNDLDKVRVDPEKTVWSAGAATVSIFVDAPSSTFAGERLDLLATPADYRIVMMADVQGNSSALFGFPEKPIRFTVENIQAGALRQILFADEDGDGYPSRQEPFYILEQDGNAELQPAWRVTLKGNTRIEPTAGDVLEIVTIKPLTEEDVYEFRGALAATASEPEVVPEGFDLRSNYPNPFAGTTTIEYQLSSASEVELVVFDILGRSVRRLDNGPKPAGLHRARWNTRSETGQTLPAGVYFYRLSAADARTGTQTVATQKMTVVR